MDATAPFLFAHLRVFPIDFVLGALTNRKNCPTVTSSHVKEDGKCLSLVDIEREHLSGKWRGMETPRLVILTPSSKVNFFQSRYRLHRPRRLKQIKVSL